MSQSGRAQATRARLYDAAVTAFAAKGFHATTTRDIAAAAGMSPAALYVHHSTKEGLLHVIALTGHRQVLDALRETVGEPDLVSRLAAMMRTFAIFHAQGHVQARVINYELAALTDEHLSEIVELRNAIDKEFLVVIEAGLAAGVFDTSDARMSARALTSLGIDIARWYRDEGSWTPELLGDSYADIALRLVGASGARTSP